MSPLEKALIDLIKGVLTPDLLKPRERRRSGGPTAGHSYHASEALWYVYGRDRRYHPMVSKDWLGDTHWWLQNGHGDILDPTADRYYSVGTVPPYRSGHRCGYLTKKPSKRAREVLRRIVDACPNS